MSFKGSRLLSFVLLCLASAAMTACGGAEPEPYEEVPAVGVIGGASWSFVSGSIDNDTLSARLYDETVDFTESFPTTPDRKVLFSPPELALEEWNLKLSLTDLSSSITVTLYDGETNFISSDGRYEFTEITDTEVHGRMIANADDDNSINGMFVLTRID